MLQNFPLAAINHLLSSQTWASHLLREHSGQTALLEIGDLSFRATITDAGRLQAAQAETMESVRIRLPAHALLQMLDSPDAMSRYAHIEGNAAFAETLSKLLQHLRPDIASAIAPYLGDVIAIRTAKFIDSIPHKLRSIAHSAEATTIGILQHHNDLPPRHDELQTFTHDLEHLNTSLNNLENRLTTLLKQ